MDAIYTAAATASGRDGRAVSSDGQLDLTLAMPPALGGDGKGTNPEQLFAAGYAACFASALGLIGRQAKIDTSEASVTAEVSIGSNGEGGFGLAVVLRVELPDALQGETGRELVEKAHQVCPYSNATRGNIPVELVVE
ncbi:organic hydroperoxide resistance protein [Streptacidiphilus sp. PB12-B1b]|uniref:organic hydroperoxide resistance protein n=1 Tax=Streptacidiphilus sp. PB12-B1b TaxID=2705012 RepID=UPI0015F902F8|nr:organic hydroperoxide resistance protein [Streptacidiphilus sp. PB12-B1b]QMU77544.1 organic hydroperoxide resistance protein [Streptacidiphilus sp. PB12-B1b]